LGLQDKVSEKSYMADTCPILFFYIASSSSWEAKASFEITLFTLKVRLMLEI
jgi:hypothetical protein